MSAVPVTVTFRHIDRSHALTSRAVDLARNFWRFNDKISRCHLTIEGNAGPFSPADICRVKVDLQVPGAQIHAASEQKHAAHNDIYVALREAVNDARQQLLQLSQRRGRERIARTLSLHSDHRADESEPGS